MESPFTLKGDRIHLAVKVTPGSSKNTSAGTKEGRLKIKIAAPAEDNKANEELRSFLAGLFGCAKKDVLLINGEKSRLKTLEFPLSVLEKLESLV